MAKWTAFPYTDADYTQDAAGLKKHWARLHAGDALSRHVVDETGGAFDDHLDAGLGRGWRDAA